jgi:hypothetical protein
MSEVKVNKISPRTNCGTVQLGDSGDTITIPAGATIVNNGTQTGFGRTGTVDWDTTAKTASFTAVSGNGYFVNTTSGAVTVTLPASPSAGNIVAVADYARTFATNNLTVARNGSNIQGEATDATISTNGQSTMFVYVDGTKGWVPTEDQTTNNYGATFITATGGTVTCCGDYKIHTFTSPGTFSISSLSNSPTNNVLDYLVVAGGGSGGGAAACGGTNAGGGGAGGLRFYANPTNNPQTGAPASPKNAPVGITASVTSYPITVGAGGGGTTCCSTSGNNSVFSSITSAGGGAGGGRNTCSGGGLPGGSGGGAKGWVGGTGNTPPVSPPQGNDGGNSTSSPSPTVQSSGGGFMAIGGSTPNNCAPYGGGGVGGGFTGFGTSGENCGSYYYFAGGGAGSSQTGGIGGGGDAGDHSPGTVPAGSGQNGTTNTGGGGGSGTYIDCSTGGSGGSGIVVIRYKFQ